MKDINPKVFDLYVLTLMAVLSAVFFFWNQKAGSHMGSATLGACAMYLKGELVAQPQPKPETKGQA